MKNKVLMIVVTIIVMAFMTLRQTRPRLHQSLANELLQGFLRAANPIM